MGDWYHQRTTRRMEDLPRQGQVRRCSSVRKRKPKVLVWFLSAEHNLQSALQRDRIMSAQARAFFNERRYFQAAQCYAQCSITFEEVTLQFLDVGERDALRSYLISRLERTRKTVGYLPTQTVVCLMELLGPLTTDDACHLACRVLPQQMQRA